MPNWNAPRAAVLLSILFVFSAAAKEPQLVTEEFKVPAGEAGIEIYVRNKHPADVSNFGPDHTLVFVHGATYPASTSFDLELGGTSMMDYIAAHGYDVYLMDLPGYGRSTRPSQMSQPAEANPPLENTADAVRHYGVVVDYVLKRRGLQKLDVMGWSWGTTIVGGFAASQPEKTNRVVLYAPVWILREPPPVAGSGAYRSVTAERAQQRWLNGVPEDKKDNLIPPGWFDAWQKATWATDPTGSAENPPVVRAPNGVVEDLHKYWGAGHPTYDPSRITAPILLVQGEWDHDTPPYMAQTIFGLLAHAPWKQYTMLGEGTHTIMMERNRQQLFYVVQSFLDEKFSNNP
ncbi:MAG: alpha/beta hydrolase [Acetobacteraceae bacterium]|nr:alpha/beta hydrolase [Acetobacteraceae bacterium]